MEKGALLLLRLLNNVVYFCTFFCCGSASRGQCTVECTRARIIIFESEKEEEEEEGESGFVERKGPFMQKEKKNNASQRFCFADV